MNGKELKIEMSLPEYNQFVKIFDDSNLKPIKIDEKLLPEGIKRSNLIVVIKENGHVGLLGEKGKSFKNVFNEQYNFENLTEDIRYFYQNVYSWSGKKTF